MKKFTFFLALFLTVSGVATTSAQNTFLQPEDITDGRVVMLFGNGNGNYLTLDAASLANFDPNETAVVVEKAEEGRFYLKKYSNGQYLQRETNNNEIILGNKDGAALFKIIKVQNSDISNKETYVSTLFAGLTVDNVIRFVTTVDNGTEDGKMVFLNSNGGNKIPSFFEGTGVNSIFAVYDAAELCKTSVNMGDAIYVGDLVITEETKNALQTAYDNYNTQFSKDNYTAVVEATTAAVESASPAEFDASLYYLIENNNDKGNYMEATNDGKLGWSSSISGSASQIWRFELDDANVEEVEKYYMTSQGVYCSTPSEKTQVQLSEKETSFYLINTSVGVYAFDSQISHESSMKSYGGENTGTGLQKGGSNQVTGWGTGAGTSKWKLKYVDKYDLVVSTGGWASLNLPFAVELPDNLTVSYPTGAEKYTYTDEENDDVIVVNSVTMTELPDKKIPANFPVVLQGEAGSYTLTILPADEDVSTEGWAENKFEGVLLPKTVNAAAMFKLAFNNGEFTLSEPAEEEGDYITIAANSAYIPVDNVTTTGITDVVADTNADNVWFDLVGRRVLNPAKGVYVNAAGKKVLFK